MKEDTLTDTERLVQRFIDQELTGEERVALLGRLAREQSLREQMLDLEQLMLQVGRLPRPAVPRQFVAGVMDRIAPQTSVWQSASAKSGRKATRQTVLVGRSASQTVPAGQALMGRLWQPHTLKWNMAGALAAAAVAVLVVGALVARPGAPAPPDSPGTASAGATDAPVLVRLVVLQPEARTVDVAGDFNGWDPTRTPLEQTATGAWTVTIPLQPGRYEYMFVVDGKQWVGDPFAVEQADDGFGSRNAVLDVRPTEAAL